MDINNGSFNSGPMGMVPTQDPNEQEIREQTTTVWASLPIHLEYTTTFLRFGKAPFGRESYVLRPMIIVCPVVNALKRFRSLGSQ